MERLITGFHADDEGDWVAELDCGHNQHVRHRPPMQWREWVLEASSRSSRIGTVIECPLCDRAEWPATLRHVRTASWNESTLPRGLLRNHSLGNATWGRLRVRSGALRFQWGDGGDPQSAGPAKPAVVLHAGDTQVIAPGVVHSVAPADSVEMELEFWTVDRTLDVGGDPACLIDRVCPDCDGVAGDGSGHKPGCPRLED